MQLLIRPRTDDDEGQRFQAGISAAPGQGQPGRLRATPPEDRGGHRRHRGLGRRRQRPAAGAKDAEKALAARGPNAAYKILAAAKTEGREQAGEKATTGGEEFTRQRAATVVAQQQATAQIGNCGAEAKAHAKLFTDRIKPIKDADDLRAAGQGADALRLLGNIAAGYAAAAEARRVISTGNRQENGHREPAARVAERATKENFAVAVDVEQQKIAPAVALADTAKYEAALNALAALDAACDPLNHEIDEEIRRRKEAFEAEFSKIADYAAATLAANNPPAKKLATEVQDFKAADKAVNDVKGKQEWGLAKDALPALAQAAKKLADGKKDFDDKKVLFEGAWNGMADRVGAEALIAGALSTKLDAAVAEYKAKKKIVTDAQANEEWGTAKDGVEPMQTAAKALVEAKKTYDTDKLAFETAWAGVTNYTPAETICWTRPMPAKLPAEVSEFKKVDLILDKAKTEEDWVTAKDAVPPLKAAITKLVPAFNDWKPFAHEHEANLYILEKARAIAAAAPAKLNSEKNTFEMEHGKIGPAVTGKNWGDALAVVRLAAPAAKALIAAQEQYDKDKKPFDDAVKAAQADYEAAQAVLAALPSGLATHPKVTAFKEAQTAVENARKDEKWSDGVDAADILKTRSQELVGAKAEFNIAFTEEDAKDIPNKLKHLEPQTKKANDPVAAPFIDPLQEKVRNLLIEVNGKVTAKDYVAAAAEYEKLVAATTAMEKAKDDFNKFKLAFDAVLNGEDKDARALGAEPATLANLRNTTLDKLKQDAKNLGDTGKLPPATKKVAAWKEEAKGWIEGWAEAKEAHGALSDPAPDENKLKDLDAKLKALAAKSGGGKVIDEMVKALGPQPSRAVMKTVMKARFGVEIELKKFQLPKMTPGQSST